MDRLGTRPRGFAAEKAESASTSIEGLKKLAQLQRHTSFDQKMEPVNSSQKSLFERVSRPEGAKDRMLQANRICEASDKPIRS